jgi:hypothetical protein
MKFKKYSWLLLSQIVSLICAWEIALTQAQAYTDAFGEYVPLSVLRRCITGTDYFSTISSNEEPLFTSEGEIAYLPRDYTSTQTSAFYRLRKGADHMESLSINEGGYTSEGVLGYPWNNTNTSNPAVPPGLTQLKRVIKNNGDHATIHSADSIGYSPAEALSGYVADGSWNAYGFARYNLLKEKFLSLTTGSGGNQVTVKSNAVAGGILSSWVWNNSEFLNNYDYGRQMQCAVSYALQSNAIDKNSATEGGDHFGHGSPCVGFYNTGNTQVTRAVPLEFECQKFSGGPDNPILLPQMLIGKDLYMNYQTPDGVARNWPVALYVTNVKVPTAVDVKFMEMPTAHMPYTFNRYYTYDAGSNLLTEQTLANGATTVGLGAIYYAPSSGYGGVIISDSTGNKAMGAYAVLVRQGGSATMFGLWRYDYGESNPSPTSVSASKWSVIRGINTSDVSLTTGATQRIWPGNNQYHTWVMTGTVAQVTSYMNTLYSLRNSGVK